MPNQIRDLHRVDEEAFPYIFEQNATIVLKNDCGHVRANVYRPKTTDKVPVLVTYGPYGKDIPYSEYVPTSNSPLEDHPCRYSGMATANTEINTDSTQRAMQKSIPSTRASIAPGKPPIPPSGPSMATRSFAQTRGVWASPRASLTPCPGTPRKPFAR